MAPFVGIGDAQFSSRIYGIMIQNFGINAGLSTPIKDYDFEALGSWLMLQQALDPQSDHAPFLAAYVFGAAQDPGKIGPVIAYLEAASGTGAGQKWRWLAQAAYLARYKMGDMDLALRLARKLAAIENPDMPSWAHQMPAFIMNAKGDKPAALALMLSILKTDADKLAPQEVNSMVAYICHSILNPQEAKAYPLCQEKGP